MTKTIRGSKKLQIKTEHTPNGGKIIRAAKFKVMDCAGLEYFFETDPICQEWEFVNQLCDRNRLPHPNLPVCDPYNRPDYATNPDGDTSWWTPHEAVKRYGYE